MHMFKTSDLPQVDLASFTFTAEIEQSEFFRLRDSEAVERRDEVTRGLRSAGHIKYKEEFFSKV